MDYQPFHQQDKIALQLRAGNTRAFRFILDQYGPALSFFAARLTGDATAAAGIVEEVALKLWKQRKQYYSLAGIRIFLYASTRESCFRYVKEHQRDLKDELTWLAIWQKTEEYVQCEMIRAEVLRQVFNNIEHIPLLHKKCGLQHPYL